MQELQDTIRYEITRFVFDNGYAPKVRDLGLRLRLPDDVVKRELDNLSGNKALVLHPNSHEIWVAHPFALFPTLFWVRSGGRQWWGNCIWCSLGIAALSKTATHIHTKIQGEAESIVLEVVDGRIIQHDLWVHFPVPARKLWDNVLFACANMLVFRTVEDVSLWCNRHSVEKGEVHHIDKVWGLAKAWYGNYLDPTWIRKTPEYAQSIFDRTGFEGNFWKVGP